MMSRHVRALSAALTLLALAVGSAPSSAAAAGTSGHRHALTLANPGSQTDAIGVARRLGLVATGGTPPYTFSSSGLPAGLAIDAAAGIITGRTTTAGTFTVTVTVTDSARPRPATASQTFTWTVGAAAGCPGPRQLLGNPGFENASAPWTASPNVIGSYAGQTAHTGNRFAWLSGWGTVHTDVLSQSVSLPAGCRTAILTFFLHVDTEETTTTERFDILTVQLSGTTIATLSNLNQGSGYTEWRYDVSAFAGRTATLRFTGTEDASLATSFVVDDTALDVS